MDKFRVIRSVGKGSFGLALLVQRKADGQQFVIKQINTTRMSRKERAEVENEVAVLSRLRCPNIVAYVDSFHYRGSLCIVMEYADGGDLEKTLKGRRGKLLPEPQVLDWFIQICLALKYVHNRKILHRDLKPANIMLGTAGSGPPVVKLGDFGIAKVLSNTMELARTAIGTPYYLSPEICREERYNNKSDIWSLGCILYEMCSLKHAFEGRNMKGLVRAIMRGKVAALPRGFSPGVTELISACLHRDARRRPRVDRILQHPLLQARIEAHLGDAARAELAHTVIHGLRPMRDLPAAAAAAAAPKPKADRGDLRAHIRRLRAQQARERAHRRASGEPAEDGPPVEVLARPMLELAAEAPGRGKDVPRGRRYDEPSPSAVVPSSLASDAPPAPPGGAGSPRRVSTSPLVSPRRHVLAPPPVGVGFVPAPRHGGGAHPQRRPIPAPAPSAAGPSPASAAAARAEDALMASIREVEAMRPRVHSPPRSGGGGGVPLIDARTEWVGGAVPRRGVQEGGAARRLDLGGHDDDDDPGIALSGDDDHSGGSDEDEDDDGDEDAEEAVAVREAEQTLRALRGEADRAALMQSMVAVSHTAGAGLDEEAARAREEQAELEDGEWLDSDEEAGEGKDDDDDDDDGLEAEEEEEEGDGGAPGAGGAAHGGATSHELAYVREVLERQVGARRLAEACSSLAELDLAEGFEAARLALGRDNEHLLPLVQRLVVTGSTVRRR